MPLTDPDLAAAADGLFVVETWDGDAFLGEIAFQTGYVVIYTGFRGRPAIVPRDGVAAVIHAADHPDVYIPQQPSRG
jgi:hypothetical protein